MAEKAMTEEFQTDGVFDVYKMLSCVRARPGLYLGTPSLTKLWDFLQGYHSALIDNNVPHRKVGPFNRKLHDFVQKHFGLPSTTEGWTNIILKQCGGDEAKAGDVF